MIKRLVPILLAGAVTGSAVAQSSFELFNAARRAWDAPRMESVRVTLLTEAGQNPQSYVALYQLGFCEFHLLLCYGLEDSSGYDPKRADILMDAAEHTLKDAVELRPQEAECRAMLASVYGFRIVQHPISAAWNGPKVLALQKSAVKNEPDNPRVHYLIGAGWFRAPAFLRNLPKAKKHLERAEVLFRAESKKVNGPEWGVSECYGLLGDLRCLEGDVSAARRYYHEALQVNPLYSPARSGLEELDGR